MISGLPGRDEVSQKPACGPSRPPLARPPVGQARPQKLFTAVEPEGRGESWALRDGLKDPRARSSQYCKPRLGGVFLCGCASEAARAGCARQPSGRVPWIERGRGLKFAVFRHFGGIGDAFLAARAQMLARDIVLARPILFPILPDLRLLTNGLSHGFTFRRPGPRIGLELGSNSGPHGDGRRCVTLLYALHQFFACSMFLFRAIRNLNSGQCRVPPSPPAIRDMKKPWQRKLAGASDLQAPHSRAGMGVRDGQAAVCPSRALRSW